MKRFKTDISWKIQTCGKNEITYPLASPLGKREKLWLGHCILSPIISYSLFSPIWTLHQTHGALTLHHNTRYSLLAKIGFFHIIWVWSLHYYYPIFPFKFTSHFFLLSTNWYSFASICYILFLYTLTNFISLLLLVDFQLKSFIFEKWGVFESLFFSSHFSHVFPFLIGNVQS